MTDPPGQRVVFFDCDDTLLDNDRFRAELDAYLAREFDASGASAYWAHYEQLRDALGYADYLGAVQRFRLDRQGDPRVAMLSEFLLDYPFETLLYPGALAVLAHCAQWGTTAMLSDGDAVFQPRKMQRAGLSQAVGERVLIYIHKDQMLDDVMARYPASHYVLVDDKLSILTAMKSRLGDRLTTVWPKQGHYALEAARRGDLPAPDVTVERIAELLQLDLALTGAARATLR